MRTIHLKESKITGDFKAKWMDHSHYDTFLENEDVTIIDNEGNQIAVILRNCIDLQIIKAAWPILSKMNFKTENRGSASGVAMVFRKKKDGTISKTNRVPKGYEVGSGVIGYYPRYPRIPFCRECAWNVTHAQEWQLLLPLFRQVNDLHKAYSPKSYDFQKSFIEKTSKDFTIPNTIYTTVTVNRNFRTAAHLDAKNLTNGMAPMLVLREGQFSGGHIVLPEWKLAAKLDTNDLIIFRNMIDYHGNTKIIPLTKNYKRVSLVFYYREEMIKCGTAEQELARAKSGQNYSINFSEE